MDVTCIDDEIAAGMTIVPLSLTMDETGGTGVFTIQLNVQPLSPVVINVTSDSTEEATVEPDRLIFEDID